MWERVSLLSEDATFSALTENWPCFPFACMIKVEILVDFYFCSQYSRNCPLVLRLLVRKGSLEIGILANRIKGCFFWGIDYDSCGGHDRQL